MHNALETYNMPNTLTAEQMDAAVSLLAQARRAQTMLWDASLELERILGCAVDTTRDLEDDSIESILERDEAI